MAAGLLGQGGSDIKGWGARVQGVAFSHVDIFCHETDRYTTVVYGGR